LRPSRNESTVEPDTARRYADLGVDRLLLYPLPLENVPATIAFLEAHADLSRQ
jgi:hypothetical protein